MERGRYLLGKDGLVITTMLMEEFGGTFEGNNKTLRHNGTNSGIFKSNTGTIRNLNVSFNCHIEEDSFGYVGVLAHENQGNITNCTVSLGNHRIVATDCIGGFVGKNYGIIENCSVTGNISAATNSLGIIGGFVGINCNRGIIRDSAAHCAFSLTEAGIVTGGFVGNNIGTVKNCTHEGSINAINPEDESSLGNAVGGFVGYNGEISGEAVIDASKVIIRNCSHKNGDIFANNCGGFAMQSAYDIIDCYVDMENNIIKGSGGSVGGFICIVGNLTEKTAVIEGCYCLIGSSACESYGGFAGILGSGNSIKNCYSISEPNPIAYIPLFFSLFSSSSL